MKWALKIFFMLSCLGSFAQGGPVGSFTPPQTNSTFLRDVFLNKDMKEKPSGSTEGTVFLTNDWVYARIKAVGRTQTYDSIKIKLNIDKNAIHFLDENNEEMIMALKVEAIMIIDSSSAFNNTVFLCNFGQQPGFFQLLEDGGKLKLLKRLLVYVWETQPLGSEKTKHFEIQGDLYLSSGSMLYNTNKSCQVLGFREIFGQNDKLLDYISQNNLHCNKEEDLRKIVKFSYSLMSQLK